MPNLPHDIDVLDYEIGLHWRTVNAKAKQILEHPDDWDIGQCEKCGAPTVTIGSGEPTWCRVCVRGLTED